MKTCENTLEEVVSRHVSPRFACIAASRAVGESRASHAHFSGVIEGPQFTVPEALQLQAGEEAVRNPLGAISAVPGLAGGQNFPGRKYRLVERRICL